MVANSMTLRPAQGPLAALDEVLIPECLLLGYAKQCGERVSGRQCIYGHTSPRKSQGELGLGLGDFFCFPVRNTQLAALKRSSILVLRLRALRRQAMEYKRPPGEGATGDFGEGLDRDYILAASGFMPETALGELPWWAWAACVAVLAIVVLALVRFG